MGKKHKKGVKTLSLRLPQSVAKAVAKRAKEQNRSLNAQIIHELELSHPRTTVYIPSSWQTQQDNSGTVTISDNA